MKVLMTTDTVGGVWSYSLELIKSLAEHDVRFSLATTGRHLNADQRRDVDQLSNVQIYESKYALEWMQNPWDEIDAAGRWLLRLRDDIQPDVIHLNDYSHGALAWDVPLLIVGHSCVSSWRESVRHTSLGPEWREYCLRVRRGLHSADLVVSPTRWMLEQLNKFYGPLTQTHVIYNGRAPLPVQHDRREPFILSAGRIWDDAKNIRLLADIAEDIPWPIYVAGSIDHPDGSSRSDWRPLRMLGQLSHDKLLRMMSRASIYALPAYYEPFGLTPLEAALTGCPLVLAEIGTLREVWGASAAFASPQNPDEWIALLGTLINAPDTRNQLSVQARHHAERYSATRMARSYFDVYSNRLCSRSFTSFFEPQETTVQ